MSETEDDDGGIDKEALREELREKYEQDDRKREATQRMSDLLLKGATMTNSHCNTCGDPLFRQNGTTFCPTCHGGPEGVEASATAVSTDDRPAPGADGADADADASDSNSTAAHRSDTSPSDGDGGSASTEPAGSDARTFDPESSPLNADGHSVPEPGQSRSRQPRDRPGADTPDRPTHGPPTDGDLDAASASLSAALERFAREAATTDDPRYARECLEAAHEAADALAALGR